MKYATALLVAGSALVVSTPVLAQSIGDASFTGPRVEVIAGYDASSAGSTADDNRNTDDQSIEGVLYGAALGYDFNAGGVVLGLEGEYSRSTADTDFQAGGLGGLGVGSLDTGRDLYAGARIGVVAQPNLLLYAKGGYTNARYELNAASGTGTFEQNIKAEGYRLGAGAEYAMTPNTFAKIEYRYSNYSDAEVRFGNAANDTVSFDIDTDRHQVVAGFGLRF